METILITGGTGMIGTALTLALKDRYKIIILSRSGNGSEEGISYFKWDLNKMTIDVKAIQQADYIIHLAGANVAESRWTNKRKKEILESRTKSGELLVKALIQNENKVKAIISSSAIGWYGPDPVIPNPSPFVESDPPANDFLGTTCQKWEAAIKPVEDLGKRLVMLRTGIVFSNAGGAYPEFKKPLQYRIAPILGTGKQIISWIHIDDLVQLYLSAIKNDSLNGIFNAVTPHPVSNYNLMRSIGGALEKKYICMPVPELFLKIGLGEMSVEVLKSTTVSSQKIENMGFKFQYATIEDAIQRLEA